MSVTEGQIRGKCHQDTNVPRSNPAISQIHRNIERHTAYYDRTNQSNFVSWKIVTLQQSIYPEVIYDDIDEDSSCV